MLEVIWSNDRMYDEYYQVTYLKENITNSVNYNGTD